MQRDHKLLIFSFLLLNLFSWVEVVEGIYGIPSIVKYILSVSVLIIIVYYKLLNPSKPNPGTFFYFVILIFILWSLKLLIFELFRFNSLFYIQRVFGQPVFFIPYLLPMLILYTKFDLEFIRFYFHYSYLFLFPAILISLFIIVTGISQDNWYEQTRRIYLFDIGSSLLLLTGQISKKKYIFNIALLYYLLLIFLITLYGRRGVFIEYLILLVAMCIIRLRSSFLKINDRLKIYFAGLVMIILLMSFGYLVTSSYVFKRGFTRAAIEDSRGVVIENFVSDFRSSPDLLFGRGLEGMVLRMINPDDERGDIIENGFLHVILKGGLLYLVPFIIIFLRASYLGFYKSNNDIAKALAAIILIYVVMMVHFNLPMYTTKYICTWIYVSMCFSPKMRNYSNEEIHKALNLPFKSRKLAV